MFKTNLIHARSGNILKMNYTQSYNNIVYSDLNTVYYENGNEMKCYVIYYIININWVKI